MSTTTPIPVKIEWGVNYPDPSQLRTGDILFARRRNPQTVLSLLTLASRLNALEVNMTVGQYIGPSLMREVALLANSPELVEDARVLTLKATGPTKVNQSMKELVFFLAILYIEFRWLVKDWFGVNVIEFLTKMPLVRLLLRAFDGHIKDGFFVGHCAMVVRESDGIESSAGKAYVIEANATSFDHYGVNITPYYEESDDNNTGPLRSWAAARAKNGDCAWMARHVALVDNAAPRVAAARQALLCAAKTYLGRGYSFFDDPAAGDSGRLYCSEFIYRAFEDVRQGLDGSAPFPELTAVDTGVRTWRWMKDHNPPGPDESDIGHAIEAVWDDWQTGPYVRNRKFFLFTVQMLWLTAAMDSNTKFKPYGEEYDRVFS